MEKFRRSFDCPTLRPRPRPEEKRHGLNSVPPSCSGTCKVLEVVSGQVVQWIRSV